MAASGEKQPDLNPETAPDPDEDDLDDLDGIPYNTHTDNLF